jgi:hypothetical protein
VASSDKPTKHQTFNVTGTNQQNAFGDGDNTFQQDNRQGVAGKPSWLVVLEDLRSQVEGKSFEEGAENDCKTPEALVDTAIEQAQTDISIETVYSDEEFEQEADIWKNRFQDLLPLGIRLTAVMGSAALDAYIDKSPIIAALQALVMELTR